MSKSLLSIIESLQKAAKKKADGQYSVVPEWMFAAANSTSPLTSSQRSQAKTLLSGAAKIDPEDYKKIVNTRNLDLALFLSKKPDITPDQARMILDHASPFAGTDHHYGMGMSAEFKALHPYDGDRAVTKADKEGWEVRGRDTRAVTKKKELQSALFNSLGSHDKLNDMLANGSEDAVRSFVASKWEGVDRANGRHLLHIITERPNLSNSLVYDITRNRSFDEGHVTEIMNRPEGNLHATALSRYNGQVSNAIKTAALNSPNADVIKSVMNNSSIDLSAQELMRGLNHSDDGVRAAAHRRAGDLPKEWAERDAIDAHVVHYSRPEDLNKFIDHYNSYKRRYDVEDYKPMRQDLQEKLLSRIENEPKAFDDNITNIIDPSTENTNRLFHAAIKSADADGSQYSSEGVSSLRRMVRGDDEGMGHKYLKPESIQHLLTTKHANNLMNYLADIPKNHSAATPETMLSIYNAIKTGKISGDRSFKADDYLTRVSRHPNTPMSVFLDMAQGDSTTLPHSIQSALASTDKLPRELWEKMAFNPNAPLIRRDAVTSPHVTSDDVTKMLADPDKDVRRNWIKRAPDSVMTPAHWDIIKKDKSALNRAASLDRQDMPPELLEHFLVHDKSAGVQAKAMNHRSMTPELLDAAVNKQNPHHLIAAADPTRMTADQNKMLLKRVKEDRVVKLAKLNKKAQAGTITPEQLTAEVSKLDSAHHLAARSLAKKNNLHPDDVNHILNLDHTVHDLGALSDVVDSLRGKGHMHQDQWENLLAKHPILRERQISRWFGQSATLSPEKWKQIADNLIPATASGSDSNSEAWSSVIASNGSVPESVLKSTLDRNVGGPDFLYKVLHSDVKRSPELMQSLFDKSISEDNTRTENYTIEALVKNPNLSESQVAQAYDHLLRGYVTGNEYWSSRMRQHLMQHANVPLAVITRAAHSDPSEKVARIAQDGLAQHDPDSMNSALKGHTIQIHPAVEKLKDFKGQIEEIGKGEPVPKGRLPNKGQGLPNEIFDAKGMVTPKSIDEFIDKLPKDKYNVSYDTWGGAQRHDRSQNQRVLQLNLTNKHIEDLKAQGLWGTFKKLQEKNFRSGHPVKQHSLGWTRIDDSQPGHAHIDEVQSDLGQGSIRDIEQRQADGEMEPAQAAAEIGKVKQMIKVLSGSFKDINHAIAAAAHQTLREGLHDPEVARVTPVQTTSYDNIEDQASQSGLHTKARISPEFLTKYYDGGTNEDSYEHRAVDSWAKHHGVESSKELGLEKFKELHGNASDAQFDVPVPGFIKSTYEQYPKSIGYKPADKKEAMPNTTAQETTFQLRKLVKSLTKLQQLYSLWKAMEGDSDK